MAKIIPLPRKVLSFPPSGLHQEETQGSVDHPVASKNGNIISAEKRFAKHPVQERRQAERVILTQFISAHVVVPGEGLVPVVVRDLDDGGLSFELDRFWGCFQRGDLVQLRFYLNGQTYFAVTLEIAYSSLDQELGLARHGGKFAPDSLNREALYYFVQFLKTVAVSLKTDRGERVVSHLTS